MPDKTIPDKLLDDAIKNQLYTEQYANGLSKQVQILLTKAQNEIAGVIAKIDPTAPTMTKWKQARLENLNGSISDILDSTFKDISNNVSKELTGMGKTQAISTVEKYNKNIGADIFNVTLTPDNVKAIVENTMIDGKVIGDWWDNVKETTKTKMAAAMAAGTQALQVGMVQGESVGELISRIRGTKTTPGIMSLTKREATALARTSVLQVANAVRQETYKANSDVLDGIQFVATLDARTCPTCRPYDGKQYDMNLNPVGHNLPWPGTPMHFNCRCTTVPITKSWAALAGPKSPLTPDQQQTLYNIPVGERSSINGPVAGDTTYQDWLITQPVEEQQSILGQGKWKLWSENKLDVADLLDNTGRELTLKELQAKLGDIIAQKQVAIENELKKLVLESKSAEEFATKIVSGKIPDLSKILQGKTPAQYYAEIKQTAEAEKAARAAARLIQQNAEEKYNLLLKENPVIAKQAEESILQASPGFEKLPWTEKSKLLESYVETMKAPAVKEAAVKEWVPVKTVQEAEVIAREKLKIRYLVSSQEQIKNVNAVGRILLEDIKTLPRLSDAAMPQLRKIELIYKDAIALSKAKHVKGLYRPFEKTIEIASRGIKDQDSLHMGRFVVGDDLGTVVRHEYGHHLQRQLLTEEELLDFSKIYKNHDVKWWEKKVSEYASTNTTEAFAECFSAYTSPLYGTAKNRFLPKEIEDYFAKIFGKTQVGKVESTVEKIVSKEDLAMVSKKVELAKQSHLPATREVQQVALKNQTLLAEKIKGVETADNAPFDIIHGKNYIELKTIVRASNDKITMHGSSLTRKNNFLEGIKGAKAFTVVIDERTNTVYFSPGLGSFRLKNMEIIGTKDNFEQKLLKRLRQK